MTRHNMTRQSVSYLYGVHVKDPVPLLDVVDATLHLQGHVLDVRDGPQHTL